MTLEQWHKIADSLEGWAYLHWVKKHPREDCEDCEDVPKRKPFRIEDYKIDPKNITRTTRQTIRRRYTN